MKVKYLLKGLVKSIPGIEHIYHFNKHTGGSSNARYCYSVWMRHLILAFANGLKEIPAAIGELGPGDTLGVGLAALISGANHYYALDIQRYSNSDRNLEVFDELVELFKDRANIPGPSEFPRLRPFIDSYDFPRHIFTDDCIDLLLDNNRLDKIRSDISSLESTALPLESACIQYIVPWTTGANLLPNTLDLIISQAVLQAVDDLQYTYQMMASWLKAGGWQSHDIGFKSCGSADTWFGHWEYSDLQWRIVRGRKNFFINREPVSTHLINLEKTNFQIVYEQRQYAQTFIKRKNLAIRFKAFSDTDLKTYSIFLQACKSKPGSD